MKLFKYSMGVVCALSLFAVSARAEEVVAAVIQAPKHVSIEQAPKKAEKAKAAVKQQKKQRTLTPYQWQLEYPQLG
jgi:hypothetical protein